MKKNESIQVLRAVAALLVVHIHSIFMVEQHEVPRQAHLFNVAGFGACGVDIFFAVSGFILSTVTMSVRSSKPGGPHRAWDFLVRRFIRIFPIYWVLSLFFVFIGIKQHRINLPWLVNSYLLSPSLRFPMPVPLMFAGWTLVFEMFFYYLITANLFFGVRRAVERTIVTIAALVGFGWLIGFERPLLILFANPMNLEFVFGCVIGLAYARYGKRQKIGTILLSVGGVLLLSTVFVGNPGIGDNKLILDGSLSWYRVVAWGLPAAMITAGLAFRSTPIRSGFGRLGVHLGDASYSIYLASGIAFFGYDRIYPFFSALGPDINVLLAFLFATAIGSACYLCLERPLTRQITEGYHAILAHRESRNFERRAEESLLR